MAVLLNDANIEGIVSLAEKRQAAFDHHLMMRVFFGHAEDSYPAIDATVFKHHVLQADVADLDLFVNQFGLDL